MKLGGLRTVEGGLAERHPGAEPKTPGEARRRLGLTVQDVARATGLTISGVYGIEQRGTGLDRAIQMSRLYQCSTYLFALKSTPQSEAAERKRRAAARAKQRARVAQSAERHSATVEVGGAKPLSRLPALTPAQGDKPDPNRVGE